MWPFTRRDSRLHREIEAHIAIETEQLIADGVSPEEARAAARRRFGNVTAARERFHESNRAPWLEPLLQDMRVAIRSSLRDRGVVLIALLSLALGIGATTAIVSTVDAVLLRPLPYREPDRLVMVWEDMSFAGFPKNTPAPANYIDWRARNRVFEDMAATRPARANLTGGGLPERVLGRRVTASFFRVLGVQPLLGRTFTEDEDRQNAPVVVISHSLWQRRYAGDPAVIGRQLTMNDAAATVIGVMPAPFAFRDREMEFWAPMAFTPAQRALRSVHFLNVVARLRPGVDLDTARARDERDCRRPRARVPGEHRRRHRARADPRRGVRRVESLGGVGDTRQQLIVLERGGRLPAAADGRQPGEPAGGARGGPAARAGHAGGARRGPCPPDRADGVRRRDMVAARRRARCGGRGGGHRGAERAHPGQPLGRRRRRSSTCACCSSRSGCRSRPASASAWCRPSARAASCRTRC